MRHIQNVRASWYTIVTRRPLKSWRLMKDVCAQKIGAQTLTIWARQNLQRLTPSQSGWRALVQVMLSLLHAVLKWDLLSDRPTYMGGVSAVLYRLLYRHDLPKYSRPVQMFAAANISTFFPGKNQKPNSAHKCPITSVQIHTWSQKLSEFSCNTFEPLNRGHPRFLPRTLKIT